MLRGLSFTDGAVFNLGGKAVDVVKNVSKFGTEVAGNVVQKAGQTISSIDFDRPLPNAVKELVLEKANNLLESGLIPSDVVDAIKEGDLGALIKAGLMSIDDVQALLGVDLKTLIENGLISPETAQALLKGGFTVLTAAGVSPEIIGALEEGNYQAALYAIAIEAITRGLSAA